ncbi:MULTISPECIES: SDR family NAD(P)-dependent oxidoreductase [Bacillales]|uniref:SDR family NAD(P)-dependent oxidoreductase n=1 Tax=Peribacillus TaxID=2675229 RepID=UPI00315D9CC4
MSKDTKVALVTGGNRGIGYKVVKQLALEGFKVILTSRDPIMGHKIANILKKSE